MDVLHQPDGGEASTCRSVVIWPWYLLCWLLFRCFDFIKRQEITTCISKGVFINYLVKKKDPLLKKQINLRAGQNQTNELSVNSLAKRGSSYKPVLEFSVKHSSIFARLGY
jgi:hypothetical protein